MLKQSGLLKKQTITIYENNKPFGLMFKRIPYERAQGGSKLTEGDLTPSLIELKYNAKSLNVETPRLTLTKKPCSIKL